MYDRDQRQEALDKLVNLIVKVLPEHAICPGCGPFVSFDEDGDCTQCGVEVTYADTRAALEKGG